MTFRGATMFKMFMLPGEFARAMQANYIAMERDDKERIRYYCNCPGLPAAEIFIVETLCDDDPNEAGKPWAKIKMEQHHPSNYRYSPRTRRIINAFQSGGWDAVDAMERYHPDIESLITRVDRQHEAQDGYTRLWGWFSLSYAAWLTLPRVLMHAMPDTWQKAMAILLEQFDEEFPNLPNLATRVNAVTNGNRFTKWPEWIANYRHPDQAAIMECKQDRNVECRSA